MQIEFLEDKEAREVKEETSLRKLEIVRENIITKIEQAERKIKELQEEVKVLKEKKKIVENRCVTINKPKRDKENTWKVQVEKLYAEGITDAGDLAFKTGAPKSYVYKIISNLGKEMEVERPSDKLKEAILQLLNEGKKPKVVAKMLDITDKYVYQVRAKYVIKVKNQEISIYNNCATLQLRGKKRGRKVVKGVKVETPVEQEVMEISTESQID